MKINKFLIAIILTLTMTSMIYGFTPTMSPAFTAAITANSHHRHKKDTITKEFDKLAWRNDTVMLVHFKYKGDKKISEQKVRYATKEECDDYNQSCKKSIICVTFTIISVIVIIILSIII